MSWMTWTSSGGPRICKIRSVIRFLNLAALESSLGIPVLIDQQSPQTVARWTALTETSFRQATLSREHFSRQFPAVLARHRALDCFEKRRRNAAVVRKLFGTVVHRNLGTRAAVFVIRALVYVLKSAPSANVIHEHYRIVCGASFDVGN